MVFEVWLLVGFVAVASNPSPYFAAFGLVAGAGSGCLLLIKDGLTFISLVLFLVYLGGIIVVFAYSAALVAEPYPESWGDFWVLSYIGVYALVLVVGWLLWGSNVSKEKTVVYNVGKEVVVEEWWGASGIFVGGGWALFIGGWVLLLTLFVALEVVRGHYSGALRAVR